MTEIWPPVYLGKAVSYFGILPENIALSDEEALDKDFNPPTRGYLSNQLSNTL